ncbi:uncharacterized protein FIBRA_06930 [Fibroporia radiculosa]|uniref:LYC1 C-terminal domain-containing protein n=1 Tax=Fibroporia radiculosa TaxID=599839 RepID=J4IBI9_9APHY|nr:uncharacterized protein FIBRA_06930 [Fibroporia radiculosa]CCM04741.1 predicted protein [Fibroporia radiculosa]
MSSNPILLENLSLFPATPEQTLECLKRTAIEWANGFTTEDFVRRETILSLQEHGAEGKLTSWVIAPRANPKTLDFMCSCDTFRRTAVVARPGADPKAKEIIAYGIASVFTPPEKRRNGYARHMMRLLHWVLAPWSTLPPFPKAWGAPPAVAHGNAQLSILYSDIGPNFYYTCGPDGNGTPGWVECESVETSLVLSSERMRENVSAPHKSSHSWMWLGEDDMKYVWEQDVEWMKADLAASASSTSRLQVAFLTDKGVGASQGATLHDVLENIGSGRPTFATWSLDTLASSRTLILTRLRATRVTFPALVERLIEFARRCDVVKIEIWGMNTELQEVAGGLGWETTRRASHLASMKWYGKEVSDEIDWAFNERFCWV